MDLDVGLSLAIFDEERYQDLTERLRQAGFTPDESEEGKPTRQRWKIGGEERVTVDSSPARSRRRRLLIAAQPGDAAGRIKNIERDFAAIVALGVGFAFLDRQSVRLDGKTVTVQPIASRVARAARG
jgi:hypothetical protein